MRLNSASQPRSLGRALFRVAALAVLGLIFFQAPKAASIEEKAKPENSKPAIVVSTALLSTAVRDLMGDSVQIYEMIPPGSCPGHYDMTPEDFRAISGADAIVLHDFQSHMIRKISEAGASKTPVIVVPEKGSAITPTGYSRTLEYLATEIPGAVPRLESATRRGLPEALAMVKVAEAEAIESGADGLKGLPIVAAHFQKDFAQYWGMEVVAEIPPGGELSAKELVQVLTKAQEGKAKVVVANAQSAGKGARVIADRLGLPLVVLSNFPSESRKGSYRGLLLSNVKGLVDARVGE